MRRKILLDYIHHKLIKIIWVKNDVTWTVMVSGDMQINRCV